MNDDIRPFLNRLIEIVGRTKVLCIVVYGSSLSTVTRSKTSTPDFFVIVESYRKFYGSWFHALLNRIFPPNVYHYKWENHQSKYSVVSLARLSQEARFPSDMYLVGRFSKKIALGWSKAPSIEETVFEIQKRAMRTVAEKTLPLMPENFSLDEFCQTAIRLSYMGDVRVEAQDKIQRLFDADPEYYRSAYAPLLLTLGATLENGTYRTDTLQAMSLRNLLVRGFLLSSRVRALLRWPKAMFTASNWLDYILQKIERTQGIKIHLTEREKKFWYIYGWKYFLLLKRKNLIK